MILLVGNFLSKHGLNPTAIEDLAIILSTRYEIQSCSNKKQPFFRMTDMVLTIICNWRKYSLISPALNVCCNVETYHEQIPILFVKQRPHLLLPK